MDLTGGGLTYRNWNVNDRDGGFKTVSKHSCLVMSDDWVTNLKVDKT